MTERVAVSTRLRLALIRLAADAVKPALVIRGCMPCITVYNELLNVKPCKKYENMPLYQRDGHAKKQKNIYFKIVLK